MQSYHSKTGRLGAKLRQLREAKGWSQEDLAAHSGVNVRAIQRLENGLGVPRPSTRRALAEALGVAVGDLYPSTPPPVLWTPQQLETLAQTLRIAVGYALQVGNGHEVLLPGGNGHTVRYGIPAPEDVHTLPDKITSESPERDPSHPIDLATSAVIRCVLEWAYRHAPATNPLSQGFHLFDEEFGYIAEFVRTDMPPRLVVFVDSADDTTRARRGIGGTSLISVYGYGAGWCAVAMGDFTRMNLYWRIAGPREPAEGLHLPFDPDAKRRLQQTSVDREHFTDPVGWPLKLRTATTTALLGASLNIYTGKAARLPDTARNGRRLLDLAGSTAEVLSEGGSRGTLLVAEGLVDAAVEFVKGFRPLDFAPGAFLAEGAGAVVVNPDNGQDISFGPDPEFEEIIDQLIPKCDNCIFDQLRQRFVVAASRPLAEAIVRALRAEVRRPSRLQPLQPSGETRAEGC
jgi:transcriptional regulator with XRE-family HTH domain